MCPPPLARRRATRNQTVKELAVPSRFPADRLSSAPDALVSDCLALFARPAVSAGGTSYSGLRHRQQFLQTFLLRCNFVEHRFGRPPHLRGGVDSGFVFWVNSLFQKSLPRHAEAVCADVCSAAVPASVLSLKNVILHQHQHKRPPSFSFFQKWCVTVAPGRVVFAAQPDISTCISMNEILRAAFSRRIPGAACTFDSRVLKVLMGPRCRGCAFSGRTAVLSEHAPNVPVDREDTGSGRGNVGRKSMRLLRASAFKMPTFTSENRLPVHTLRQPRRPAARPTCRARGSSP